MTTPLDLDAMRADATRAARAQADVPACDFTTRTGGPDDATAWAFAEMVGDFHKGRYLYLCAPAAVVDETTPERFASAIVAARADVATLATHVLALAGEVERLTAAAAAAKADREADPCPGSRRW